MHPMIGYWRHRVGCGAGSVRGGAHGAPPWGAGGAPAWGRGGDGDGGDDLGGGAFGVRRPLRFLAQKLELDAAQVAEFARILSDLKTERAQAAVDDRRTASALADALTGEAFDGTKARQAAQSRVGAAERLRDAVIKALTEIHAALRADQRQKLAYLIRTGTLLV